MFHNSPLPPPLWDLSPPPTVRFGSLPAPSARAVLAYLKLSHLTPDNLLRPAQSTAPMGFTSSVIIAHVLVSSIARSAFTLPLRLPSFLSHPSFNPSLSLFQRSSGPFLLQASYPIDFIIIDDISVIFYDWTDEEVSTFHFRLRDLLRKAGFPMSEAK